VDKVKAALEGNLELGEADKEKLLQEVTRSVKTSLAIHDASGASKG